jgi:hypothetical protein
MVRKGSLADAPWFQKSMKAGGKEAPTDLFDEDTAMGEACLVWSFSQILKAY